MRDVWQWKPLGEVCRTGAGGTPLKEKKQYYDNGNIPWLMSGEVSQGDIRHATKFITKEGLANSAAKIFPENTVLVAMYGATAGQIGILRFEASTNQAVCGILPSSQFIPEFLYYLLLAKKEELVAQATGNAQPNISQLKIRNTLVPIVEIAEQQRIIAVLDEAFEGIAKAKANADKNLQNARAIFESHLQSLFTKRGKGWVEKHLPEIAREFGRGKSKHRPRGDPRLLGGKYPLIQTGDVANANRHIVSYSQTYNSMGLAQSKLWPRGTVCIAIVGANVAETAILDFDSCFPDSVIGVVVNEREADPEYVQFVLSAFKSLLKEKGKGTARDNINIGTFESQRFPFPSVAQQRAIVVQMNALATEIDRLESIYRQKLAALEALKASLLHQAFSGELINRSVQATVVPFPTTIPGITTTDLHAGILATAYDLHEKSNLQKYFGHVKAEKIAHMVEAHLGIDLARTPIKDAAGPNDYPHLLKVEHRARKAGYFNFERTTGGGYRVKKLREFDALVKRTRESLSDKNQDIDELLELMLPLNTQQTEICATVYAAWNNLLLDGQKPTDEEIVFEAREDWHSAKLNIPREKFFAAIEWLREQGVVASGRGNKVSPKSGKK